MPRGAAPGERRGGKQKGTKNRSTIERERVAAEIAARTVADARLTGKPLAKEVLDEFMQLFFQMAGRYKNRHSQEKSFLKYADLAITCATKLAPYQSPTFRAVNVTTIGEGVAPVAKLPGDDARVINLANDPIAVQAHYRRAMKLLT